MIQGKSNEVITNKTQDSYIISIFKNKIMEAIDDLRKSKKRPDIDSIYNYVTRNEASNIDIDLIETIIVELINENKLINLAFVTCHLSPLLKA